MPVLHKLPKPSHILSMAILLAKKKVLAKAYPTQEFPEFDVFAEKIRRQKEHSIYASASELYYAAFFGRDAIEAAEDLLYKDPGFARELIPLLASHQGTQYNLITEEEPGRIHHEYRMSPKQYFEVTGEELPSKVAAIYERLAGMWGGNEREMTYYGSVDATPLYIKLITSYIFFTKDREILDEVYTDKDGRQKTIQESLLDALEWLTTRIEKGAREDMLAIIKSPQPQKRLPLLEYKKVSEFGITNQTWKDSLTSVLHEDGSLANNHFPIATIELQGHAYDALVESATLLEREFHTKARQWRNLATRVQNIVLEKFWLSDKNYFAMAMDRDKNGNYRLVRTLTSDQTELLSTKLFDNLKTKEQQAYISGIVEHVYSDNFLTPVGIRSRALTHDNLISFWDYHGSRAVWIKATYDFVKGLEKQGFNRLAKQLEYRILNGIRVSGSFYELFYVAPNGKVAYDPQGRKKTKAHEEITATTIPEPMQTWTASAVAAIEYELSFPQKHPTPALWRKELEDTLLRSTPHVALITSPRKAYKAFPHKYSFTINTEKGKESEENFKKQQMNS